eukprot:1419553-Pleurochrysis_carterae.AAC.1
MPYRLVASRAGVRDELWTSTDQLAHAPCFHKHFCASGSIQNDYKGHVLLLLGVAAGILLTSTHLTVDNPAHFAGGPWLV